MINVRRCELNAKTRMLTQHYWLLPCGLTSLRPSSNTQQKCNTMASDCMGPLGRFVIAEKQAEGGTVVSTSSTGSQSAN